MTRIAVTGHRPDKLGGYEATANFRIIRHHMCQLIMLFDNPTLLSGGALGIDQLWIEAGIELGTPVEAILPFEGYSDKWPLFARRKYQDLLDKCSAVRYVSEPGYETWKLQKRNEWLVDDSDVLVAYWTGVASGTKNCIDYAKSQDSVIVSFNPDRVIYNAKSITR